jgi:hypothetical protein
MKKFLSLTVFIAVFGCGTYEEPTTTSPSTSKMINGQYHIGDENRSPDLYIPQLEQDWQGWTNGMGLWNPPYKLVNYGYLGLTQDSYIVTIPRGETEPHMSYPCFIANGADYKNNPNGKNDFVSDRSEDGIQEEVGSDYIFPGMLSIVTFQDGLPIGEVKKQSFWVEPSDAKVGYNWDYPEDGGDRRVYDNDTMSIPAGTADLYSNEAKVRHGKNLIVVEINPDLLITESNYNNNVSVLPVNVNLTPVAGTGWIGIATLDTSAIEANKTHPAKDVVVTKNFKGASKYITIDWQCPYHEPIYVKHWFTLKKNGVVVKDKFDESIYTDYVSGSFKSATYEITIHVTGLGSSPPTTITVKR